jgi:hypothetical protein
MTKLPSPMNEMMKKCAKPNECNDKVPQSGMGSNVNFWITMYKTIVLKG